MSRTNLLSCVLGCAATLVAIHGEAAALPPRQTCVNPAVGVPTRPGPPDWWDAASAGGDVSLDDPRWNEASGESFFLGGAQTPLHTRTLWANEAGKHYLYVSFISDLAPNNAVPRDIFLGLRRVHPDGTRRAHIFEFHLGATAPGDAQALAYCGKFELGNNHECPPSASWWRMFADGDLPGTCPDDGSSGEQYSQFNPNGLHTPAVAWMTNAVHYWQASTTAQNNRWAIQARILFATDWQSGHGYAVGDQVLHGTESYECITAGSAAASGGPAGTGTDIVDGTVHWKHLANAIDAGMELGSTLWYEAMESPAPATYTSLAKFPTQSATQSGVTKSVCLVPGAQDALVHQELGDLPPTDCPLCDVTKFATFRAFSPVAHPDTECDQGLSLKQDGIGARYDTSLTAAQLDTATPLSGLNQPAANTLIAQVKNTTGAPIDIPLMARFRLANWGTTAFTQGSTDIGVFQPIRGTAAGVCSGGNAPPLCTGSFQIPAHGQKAITFNWILNDTEKCLYGLPGPCTPCLCDPSNGCDPTVPANTMGTTLPGTTTCVPRKAEHQCMYVELSAPQGGATLVQQSAFNNMQFGGMSTLAREALIDARTLPAVQGQLFQDIYLMVMPRNMPASVPPTTTTFALVQDAALASAGRIAQPYIDDLGRLPPNQVSGLVKRVARAELAIRVPPKDEGKQARIRKILLARRVMTEPDAKRVGDLLVLATKEPEGNSPSEAQVRDVVTAVGPEAAAEIVPTLEIYPFYRPGDRGRRYEAMTAFTVFLSHESTLSGIRYELDGAQKVSENVYHLRIPVGNARKIQVRAQALVGGEAVLTPGNASWPCAGGCACGGGAQRRCGLLSVVGNTTPGLIAGVLVVRRRKKRPAKVAA